VGCELNVHRLLPLTEAEGPGKRCCVWLQGCSHHCKGCFAEDTWDTAPRLLLSPSHIVEMAMKSGVEGITVLGGEPFDQPEGLAEMTKLAWASGLSTLVFTGYTHEQLIASGHPHIQEALAHTDVLIDGPYIAEQRSFNRPLVGSDNQRILFLTNRYSMADFKPNRIELRISKEGSIAANGMGNMETVKQLMTALQSFHQQSKNKN
jgi:anaerobic ribonucleoside-triphosphate reductase activating protein